MRDPLLDDLDPTQRAAVTSDAQPLAIIAPAGSGKTRVLTRRIAFRVREGRAEARHVLAVTFTRKASGELVDRIARAGVEGPVTAGTFHAIALSQLRSYAADRNREPPHILDRKARILSGIVGGRGPAATVALGDLAAEIEWAKARCIEPDGYVAAATGAGRRLPRPAPAVADVYARYEDEKRRRRVYDFDDLLRICARTIEHDEAFAAAQRWRFRHVFVDEFQDATPLQLRLLRAWLADRTDLTVVGDPAQAIYGFAGADASTLVRFADVFSGGDTIALDRNYRSTPAIVRLAETALGGAVTGARHSPVAVRPDGTQPRVAAYADDAAEAAGVAAACHALYAGGLPWSRMAVLFRTNAQSGRFEAAFAQRGIPFRTGTVARFVQRPAVKYALDWIRDLERERPGVPFSQLLADLAAAGDEKTFNTDELVEHRDTLVELGRDFAALDIGGGVQAFATWLDSATGTRAHTEPGVDLLTFHRAKGLEWSVVFVTGLERGLVPIASASRPDSEAEERRLLHVALSRAEDELHCSWAQQRRVGTRVVDREPSPWLPPLEHELVASTPRRRSARDHLGDLRATLAATPAAEPPAERARRLRR